MGRTIEHIVDLVVPSVCCFGSGLLLGVIITVSAYEDGKIKPDYIKTESENVSE